MAADGGADSIITLFDQAATRFSRVTYHSGFHSATSSNSDNTVQVGAGGRRTSQDTDAVQFLFESGNITSGKWALYGLA